jgi:hypothetical protein
VLRCRVDASDDVLGMDLVADASGDECRRVGDVSGCGWRDDQQVDAVAVSSAQGGQQTSRVASEEAQPQDATGNRETARMTAPVMHVEHQSSDRSVQSVDGQHESGKLRDWVEGAGPPASVEEGVARPGRLQPKPRR